jgi:hypothetical protein
MYLSLRRCANSIAVLFVATLACSSSEDERGGVDTGPCGKCSSMAFGCGWDDGTTDYCVRSCEERNNALTDDCQREYDVAQ